jgi:hypothetical protein
MSGPVEFARGDNVVNLEAHHRSGRGTLSFGSPSRILIIWAPALDVCGLVELASDRQRPRGSCRVNIEPLWVQSIVAS